MVALTVVSSKVFFLEKVFGHRSTHRFQQILNTIQKYLENKSDTFFSSYHLVSLIVPIDVLAEYLFKTRSAYIY
ncbi:MAG: hypothetical protein HZB54_06880 [Deltaproteobacteria bacterium]|nr:hypothetical protein [Deltaproteobacteria bacterium]